MRAASRWPVWSFQSQHWAARLSRHCGMEGERDVVGVHRQRAGAGGVDADADDLRGGEARARPGGLGEGAADGVFQAEEVIARMLAGEVVVAGVEEDALLAGGIIDDAVPSSRPSRTSTTRARTELVP